MNANNLARIRKLEGYTQQSLADAVGITRQQISAIEAGKSLPSVPTAKAIARVLGIKWEKLFEPGDSVKASEELKREATKNGL